MDDTIISQNSWYKLNLALGVTHEEDTEMYDSYGAGKLSYEDWTKALMALYRKHGKANRTYITEVLSHFELADGAKEAINYLKKQGYELAIVSGSFDTLVNQVANELGVTYRKGSTSLVFNENEELVDIKTYGDEGAAKLRHLEQICKILNIPITQCACIGDGANDREMFEATKHGMTFPDSPVSDVAWKNINSIKDLIEIFKTVPN